MKPEGTVLLGQSLLAVILAVFILIAPFDIVTISALIWIPLVILLEIRWRKMKGYPVSLALRAGLFISIIALAMLFRPRYEDTVHAGPLSSTKVELRALVEACPVQLNFHQLRELEEGIIVEVPSTTPTLREVIDAIRDQTGYEYEVLM
jgi:hypothetical protein